MIPSLFPTNVANGTNAASAPRVGALATIGHSDVGNVSDVSDVSGVSDAAPSDRWRIVCALLRRPERETQRLVRLLERLPAARRVHLIRDDNRRGV